MTQHLMHKVVPNRDDSFCGLFYLLTCILKAGELHTTKVMVPNIGGFNSLCYPLSLYLRTTF